MNLSPRSLETEAFNPFELLALCRRHDIAPSRIVVELTEREAVEDMGRLREALDGLRRHGMRTAADDVGAGNAGLRLLTEVDFDMMKIDLSLVRAGAATGTSDAVLRALRDLAERRGQSIVAEGVETLEQLEVVIAPRVRLRAGLPARPAVPGPRRPRRRPRGPRAAGAARATGSARGGRTRRARSPRPTEPRRSTARRPSALGQPVLAQPEHVPGGHRVAEALQLQAVDGSASTASSTRRSSAGRRGSGPVAALPLSRAARITALPIAA